MSRSLSKEIFGEAGVHNSINKEVGLSKQEIENRKLSLELFKVKKKLQELESKQNSYERRLGDLIKGSKKGFERLNGSINNLEKNLRTNLQEVFSNMSVLKGKMLERRSTELKVQELVDRHNSVLQSFETRIGQMQKVMNEQEMQLLAYKSMFREIQTKLGKKPLGR